MDAHMSKISPLLTIAIPTFNSLQYVPRVIEGLVHEISNINSELVEVLISDNNSTDGTFEYLLNADLPQNFYISKNSSNFGFEFQIRKFINSAKGEFLWTLGSQDFLKPGGLKAILDKLAANPEITHLLLNFSIDHEDPKQSYIESQYNNIPIPLKRDIFNYFRYLGGPAMAMSANIAKTRLLQEASGSQSKFTNWVHLEFLLKSIFRRRNVELDFLSKPSFTLFRERDGWWNTSAMITVYIENYELISNFIPPGMTRFHQQYRKSGKFLNLAIDNALANGIEIDEKIQKSLFNAYRFSPYFWIYTYRKYWKTFRK
jgi:glycosyltransferase involved in cell wall biosynthesis